MTKSRCSKIAMSTPENRIQPTQFSEDSTYFTFLDGRLRYDCAKCGAACCRGHGYNVNRLSRREIDRQNRPNLHLFVSPARSNAEVQSVLVNNCPPTCFFLDRSGKCEIHLQHGFSAKPETCRLFPFNQFCRAGNVLVVSPHTGLCPLEISPQDSRDDNSRHDVLIQNMRFQGITARVPKCNEPVGLSLQKLLQVERAVLAKSKEYEAADNYETFAAAQLDLTYSLVDGCKSQVVDKYAESSLTHVRSSVESIIDLIGLTLPTDATNDTALVRPMVVLTPTIRALFVLHPQGRGAPSVTPTTMIGLPFLLLGVLLLSAAAKSAGMNVVTAQTIFHLSNSFGPMLLLLSSATQVMVWKPEIRIPLVVHGTEDLQLNYMRVARALLPKQQWRRRRTLAEILLENSPTRPSDRMRFLMPLSHLLVGKITSLSDPEAKTTTSWHGVKCAVQRAGLSVADEQMLLKYLIRRSGNRPSAR